MSSLTSASKIATKNVAITCIVGDETGLLKSVHFPNVFAKKSDIVNDNNNNNNNNNNNHQHDSKRRKMNNGDRHNDIEDEGEEDVIIDEQDRIDQQREKERKKKLMEAIKPKTIRINGSTTQERNNGIDALCIDRNARNGTIVSIATRSGIVQEWSTERKKIIAQTKLQHFNVPNAMTKTKSPTKKGTHISKKNRNAHLSLYSKLNGIEKVVGICNVGNSDGGEIKNVATCSNFGNLRISSLPSNDNKELHMSVGEPISKMRQSPFNRDVIAVGGKQLDLRLYSLNEKKQIWKAKNVPNDWLNMPVPVWVCDMDFFKEENGDMPSSSSANHHKLVVGTGFSEIRIYDTRAGQKPVHFYELPNVENKDKPPFMSVCASPDGKSVFAGDTQGRVLRVDVGTGKVICKYKSFTGSVRRLQVHPKLNNVLLSISIDRILRVHHIESRKLLMRMYLKQRLNAMEVY